MKVDESPSVPYTLSLYSASACPFRIATSSGEDEEVNGTGEKRGYGYPKANSPLFLWLLELCVYVRMLFKCEVPILHSCSSLDLF